MRQIMLAGVFVLVAAGAASAQPAEPARPTMKCFFANQFQDWKAPDAKTIFIRVTPERYFRLDLAGECGLLRFPDSHLITVFRGSDTVCSALDWDLKVAQSPNGIPEACIVKSMTELAPAEVQAIPPHFRP